MAVRGKIPTRKPVRTIQIKNNIQELSDTAAAMFVATARDIIAKRGSFSVALAGGSTPRELYSLLASTHYRDKVDWSKLIFFFGDERNVPPDSPESNYRMANETLLSPLGIDTANVHHWLTELPTQQAAEEYDNRLSANGPLDLVLLGLGADAHTASLFPNTQALHETEKLAVVNWVEKIGAHRLTMTFPAINYADTVMFLVAGGEKAPAVRNVIEGDFYPDDFPAQLVQPHSGNLVWLLDKAAASDLEGDP